MRTEERANEGNPLIRYLKCHFTYIRRDSSVFLFGLSERFINGQGLEMFMATTRTINDLPLIIVLDNSFMRVNMKIDGYACISEDGEFIGGHKQKHGDIKKYTK